MIERTVYKEDIEEELRRIRDELDSLEEKLRKGFVREAFKQLDYVIDDVDSSLMT
jgi:hypothetical protein